MFRHLKVCAAIAASTLLAAAFAPAAAHASIVFQTGPQTNVDGAVDATATFDFLNANTLQLVLTNNVSAASHGQSISGFTFDFTGFTITGLTSATGNTINFQTSATATAANILTSGVGNWSAAANSSTEESLSALGGGQPLTLIIGPSGSPNGNLKNFEPYVNTNATFTFAISGKTDIANIISTSVLFGTNPSGQTFPGNPGSGSGQTPEPASLSLLSAGALALLARRRRTKI